MRASESSDTGQTLRTPGRPVLQGAGTPRRLDWSSRRASDPYANRRAERSPRGGRRSRRRKRFSPLRGSRRGRAPLGRRRPRIPRFRRRHRHAQPRPPSSARSSRRSNASSKRLPTPVSRSAQYESYVAVAERVNALAPGDFAKKTLLVTTGAEATENAVKIARAATGRSAVVSFHLRLSRPNAARAEHDRKVDPYKGNFGPFAPDVHHAPYPDARRGWDTRPRARRARRTLRNARGCVAGRGDRDRTRARRGRLRAGAHSRSCRVCARSAIATASSSSRTRSRLASGVPARSLRWSSRGSHPI